MKSFTTEDYVFEVDGKKFSLPEITIDGFAALVPLYEIDNVPEQMAAFQGALIEVADDKTEAAIRKLGIRKSMELFKDWSGVSRSSESGVAPGEPSPSPDSPKSTDEK